TYGTLITSTASTDPALIQLADFNGDGLEDLVRFVTTSNQVMVSLGNGDGTFRAASTTGTGNYISSVATGDFNGDGRIDMAVSNNSSKTISMLYGNGDGTFRVPASSHAVIDLALEDPGNFPQTPGYLELSVNGGGAWYVWFDDGSSSDPGLGGVGIRVDVS